MEITAGTRPMRKVLLEEVTYVIPDYQRPYSWSRNEIRDMLNDVMSVADRESEHYFGAFVFNREREKSERIIEVIDGQQRLITVAILLYVLRYIYSLPSFKDKDPGVEHRRQKMSDYLEFVNNDGELQGSKIRPGEVNINFFEDYVVKGWNKNNKEKKELIQLYKDNREYENSKSIKEAYDFILKYIFDEIISGSDLDGDIRQIKKLHDALLDKLEVVEIFVSQDADAFVIFESLNDRGLDLSSVDLIKNRLFKNCANDPRFDNVKDTWLEMVKKIGDNSIVKKFIRHYWMATYDFTTPQSLFKEVGNKAKSADFSISFVNDLNKLAPYYTSLSNPYSASYSKKLTSVLADMKLLGFDLTHPILIAGFKYLRENENELFKLTRLCLNFLVRYILVLKEKPTSVQKQIAQVARALRSDISIVSELFAGFAKDSEFKEEFKTLSVNPKSDSTYFILTEYEKTLHIDNWQAPNRAEIEVEHILPQKVNFSNVKPPDAWALLYTKEEFEVYLNRLGNLTLLGPKANKKGGNKPFSEKRPVYADDTDMKMTQNISKLSKWTVQEIDDRQRMIAEKAVDIFTLDINKL